MHEVAKQFFRSRTTQRRLGFLSLEFYQRIQISCNCLLFLVSPYEDVHTFGLRNLKVMQQTVEDFVRLFQVCIFCISISTPVISVFSFFLSFLIVLSYVVVDLCFVLPVIDRSCTRDPRGPLPLDQEGRGRAQALGEAAQGQCCRVFCLASGGICPGLAGLCSFVITAALHTIRP